ncbi:sensor histidine kinase [Cohnella hashimotonis]|uniref:histidine kinase n=1 Tax=Cohnella hashimotonis TaxID=2826895 RepID=A0ABT6TKN4_9BACL|nr:HAMP domain-containing sensor histidine kinase [Cohnella hashimotonis]MDI4647279.1 HAMP domain-containing sensor histidine kinase [Cohnella hashimotonis]
MQTQAASRQTLLSRWTYRYALTLLVGLLAIGAASALWIRQDTLHERKQSLKRFAVAAAEHVTGADGAVRIPDGYYEWIDGTQREYRLPGQFALAVYEPDGTLAFYKAGPGKSGAGASAPAAPAAPPQGDRVQASRQGDAYMIIVPIGRGRDADGSLLLSYSYGELARVEQNYPLMIALLLSAGLLGWTIIFLLSRHLRKPIYRLRDALRQMEAGDYRIDVPADIKEKELHELLVSFGAMAARLGRLEALRTELLAGVTHELKTPVASIRGLISAVRDEVVKGAEAAEFLDISLAQTRKLEVMVDDLLEFNAFASGSVVIRSEPIDLGKLLAEVVYQWGLPDWNGGLNLTTALPDEPALIDGDAGRIQQIVVNLLNNAGQAMGGSGSIKLSIVPQQAERMYEIVVEDDGPGIPEEEQERIFERYYRGSGKKLSVGGLGLGLTYCRMLAVAMGGSLALLRSSPQGTAFRLLLPMKS